MIAALVSRRFDQREQRLLETVSRMLAMDRRLNSLKIEKLSRAVSDLQGQPERCADAAPCEPPRAPHDDVRQRGAPEACALPDGRIALFVGGGYRYLTRAEALAYARHIVDAVLNSSPVRRKDASA